MKTLAEMFSELPDEDLVCITPEKQVTRREILLEVLQLRESGAAMTDPIVSGIDIVSAIARMIALDGFASALYLVPADISDALRADVRELANGTMTLRPGAKTQWVIPTSGTSGTPKLVAHNLPSLIRNLKTNRSIGADLRWALLYDPCRFAGLQVTLQACISGSAILAQKSTDIEEYVDFLCYNSCTSISATPSMWRKILSTASAQKLKLRHITLGGEISDEKILQRLRLMFPEAKVTHIYASTEAGVGFSVKDGRAGFPSEYLKSAPGGKVELKISTHGILQIRGQNFDQRYIGQPHGLTDKEGFIDTGDMVKLQGDRVFFLGRANGSINVGGEKVMPEEVENVIRSCPGVRDVRAYSKPNPVLGSIVVADIVAYNENNVVELKKKVKKICHIQLEPVKRPAIIHIVDEIKLTGAGKMKRGNQ